MIGYVGLGSNLGDRNGHLVHGIQGMDRGGLRVLAVSSAWETEPVDSPGPLWFLNAAARIETERTPVEVLNLLQAIERSAGRVRSIRNAPRCLDLDLLLLGDLRVRSEGLTVPHPRMWTRRFVLAPLAELEPGLVNTDSGRTVREELMRLGSGPEVRKVGVLALPERRPV